MACLEEAQHNRQDWQDQHDGETDIDEIRQSFMQCACHHGNPRLDVPVTAASQYAHTLPVNTCGRLCRRIPADKKPSDPMKHAEKLDSQSERKQSRSSRTEQTKRSEQAKQSSVLPAR